MFILSVEELSELSELLEPHGLELKTLADFANSLEVEETGDTFAANARLKATEQAVQIGEWVLGEDSGLSVDALGGAPGVYSARFSGAGATDEENNTLLLAKLSGVPLANRTAHYACYAALSDPQGIVRAERPHPEPKGPQGSLANVHDLGWIADMVQTNGVTKLVEGNTLDIYLAVRGIR